jgi:hypothetical protein
MTIDHNFWRDQQLNGFKNLAGRCTILEQESVMLNFVKTCTDVVWRWAAPDTKFKKICQEHIMINNDEYDGVIIFGTVLLKQTTQSLVNTIQQLTSECRYAYVAINRYEVIQHDLNILLPDSINDSLDTIMHHCNNKFKRLHTFDQVDGNHMVAAHPMDCYGLCR